MFAVVRTGGKQFRVAPGDKIVVDRMDGDAGDRITLGDVLLAGDGGDLKSTDGLTVAAEIIAQAKGDKVTVFKKRRRHNYRRKQGHRQQHTILKIVAIGDKKAAKADKPAPSKAEAPAEAKPAAEAPTKAAEAKADKPAATKAEARKAEKKAAPAKSGRASTENAAPAKAAPKKTAPKAKK